MRQDMEELKFASTEEALQHLSDITGKNIKIAAFANQGVESSYNKAQDAISQFMQDLDTARKNLVLGFSDLRKLTLKNTTVFKYLQAVEAEIIDVKGRADHELRSALKKAPFGDPDK